MVWKPRLSTLRKLSKHWKSNNMKVYLYGNTLNCGYDLTKILRQKGIDAELFLDRSSPLEQDFPWWDDKSLSPDNLPAWVHYYPIFPNFIYPTGQTKQMIEDFSKGDVALVCSYGPIIAMKSKIPFVFYSVGSDLNMIDFKDDFKALLFNTYSLKLKIKKFIKILTFGRMQAKALKSAADRIICYMGYQYRPFIINHGLQDKTVKLTYPKDIVNYTTGVDDELSNQYKQYDFVFFMVARQSWKSVWNDMKGNDKFIRSFARFVKEKSPNVLLLMANKGIDLAASKALVKELDIEAYVEWVDNMPRYQLKKYQAMPNIVMVDSFWHDKWYERYAGDRNDMRTGFGLGAVESLSSKSLLITSFNDQEFYNGETPPILNAFSEEEIYNCLLQLGKMSSEEINRMKQAGYDFIFKWNEQNHVIETHIAILKEVYEKTVERNRLKN